MYVRFIVAVILILCCSLPAQAQSKACGKDCYNEKKDDPSKETSINTMETGNKTKVVACKLTSPELQKRKQAVLASLRQQVQAREELSNGFKYKFSGTDALLDEIIAFIKSERKCCDFFTFGLAISDDQSNIFLSITGPDGAKDFIKTEMDL